MLSNVNYAYGYRKACCRFGDYAIIMGGHSGGNPITSADTVEKIVCIDNSLTATVIGSGIQRYDMGIVSLGDYCLFGGGSRFGEDNAYMWYLDKSLTVTSATPLSNKGASAGITISKYALFSNYNSTNVNVYSI